MKIKLVEHNRKHGTNSQVIVSGNLRSHTSLEAKLEGTLSFRTFNPWTIQPLFQMKTLQPLDTSTHIIKTNISTHVLNSVNPYIYLVQLLFLRLVYPYIEDVSIIGKPIFTGNKGDDCQLNNAYIQYRHCVMCVEWVI